jgi:hypothetical protein
MDLDTHKHVAEHTANKHTSAIPATALVKASIRSIRTLYVLAADVAPSTAVDVDWINDELLCSTGAARCMPWKALEASSIPERASARFDDSVLGVGSSTEPLEAEALRGMVSVSSERVLAQLTSEVPWVSDGTSTPGTERPLRSAFEEAQSLDR